MNVTILRIVAGLGPLLSSAAVLTAGCGDTEDAISCRAARKAHDAVGWQRYLGSHPSGKCVSEAASALQRISDDEAKKATERRAGVLAEARRALKWKRSEYAKVWFTESEITVGEFARCGEAGTCTSGFETTTTVWRMGDMKRTKAECNYGHAGYDGHPMNCVSWETAQKYCAWLGARLPTRDEWIAEATAGTGRKFPWGDSPPSCSRAVLYDGPSSGCGHAGTWPVCSKPGGNSVSGLCDMIGNVSEFTGSKEELADASHGNPYYVTLGGSYGTEPGESGLPPGRGCAGGTGGASDWYRNCAGTSEWDGFRCVSDAPP